MPLLTKPKKRSLGEKLVVCTIAFGVFAFIMFMIILQFIDVEDRHSEPQITTPLH